jgi:outer membrane biosynthesis protein TonB
VSTGDLEKSLRADIESHVGGRLSGLKEDVERLQSQLNEALTRLSERLDDTSGGDAAIAVAVSEHLRNARNLGIEAAATETSRARASSDIALIKAAVDELNGCRTQADILNALVNRSAAFAPRVAFFVVKNERATGWRARGLEGTVGDDSVRELSLPISSDTLLGEVVRARSTWSGGPGSHADDHSIYTHFGGEPPQRMVAVPLVARERAVAVLYADSAGQDADAVNLEALETLVGVAGMAVELLAARHTPRAEASAAATETAAPAPQVEAEQPQAEEAAPTEEVPAHEPAPEAFEPQQVEAEPQPEPEAETVAAHEPAHEYEPAHEPAYEPAPEPSPSFAAQAEESFAPQAEASTAFEPQTEAAPSFASTESHASEASAVSPLGTSRRYGSMDMDFPVEVAEEDKRFHNEARRFARLLVSEIKLYNEQKVREGRDAGDLYERLREDIDRSRQMYDKRVRPEVASRYDYFHHELVKMLAEGDAARLGARYPGANV